MCIYIHLYTYKNIEINSETRQKTYPIYTHGKIGS